MGTRISRRRMLGGMIAGSSVMALSPGLSAFTLRPQPGIVRLSANETPYGPSPKALAAAAQAAARGAYYPGLIQRELLSLIATAEELSLDQMALSSGSNEALCAAMAAYGAKGKILAPELTYGPHLRYAAQIGVEVVRIPLAEDMSIDLDAMARAVDDSVSLVYICNPNNPTGMLLDDDQLRSFCRNVGRKATVLVDEAYNELTHNPASASMLDLVRGGENVIVMRTFSKIFALAGLRIGYVMAPVEQAALLRNTIMAWPNVVGMAAAFVSYEDEEFIAFSRQMILQGREMVCEVFAAHDVPYLPSQTNFVYADIGRDATEFARRMLQRGVRIRGTYEPYSTYSRVSMGRLEELEVFAEVFHEVYSG